MRELCAAALQDGGRVTVHRVMQATGLKRRRAYELLADVRGELGTTRTTDKQAVPEAMTARAGGG